MSSDWLFLLDSEWLIPPGSNTLVVAIGAGLGVWGVVNLLEGYGNDNRATRS